MPKILIILLLLATSTAYAQTITLATNGKTTYTIVLPMNADSNETKAAKAFQKYLRQSTRALAPISRTSGVNNIIIKTSTASAPYSWMVNKNNLYITGNTSLRTLESVYAFLENAMGCKFLTPTAEIVPNHETLEISGSFFHTPAAETRTVHARLFYDHPEFAAKRRVTTEGFPLFVPEARVHTFHRFLPEKNFFFEHPEYYALVNGKRQPTQLCLSNDTVFQLVKDSVAALFQRYPKHPVLSVSQDDNTQYCTCPRCAATDQAEGTPAATMLRFVNRIAREFPTKTIATLAYQYTRKAPKTIRPEKNVLITLCSIECDRSASINEKCKDFETNLKEWGALGARLQIWDYTTQFTNFLAPFPNLETLKPNINLFVNNGANWIFEQHSHQPSELYELRCYLMAQLLWEPLSSYDSLLNIFCRNYYGPAAPAVLEYVQGLHRAINQYPNFFLFLYGDPAQGFSTWLKGEDLQRYNHLFDEAEKTLADQPEFLARLHAARLGIDFATLEYHRLNKAPFPLSDTAAVFKRLARFRQTAATNNVLILNEMGLPLTDYLKAYQTLLKSSGTQNLAYQKPVTLLHKPVKYANEDPQTLTDGAFGGWSFYANWLGFLNDMVATVDLGSIQEISMASVNFLQVTNHVVFFPIRVDFEVSDNGIQFTKWKSVDCPAPLSRESKINDVFAFRQAGAPVRVRYVRVTGYNMKKPPYWHHAAGTGAWIFADEIVIR
jgi:hypothetical protein